MKHKPPQPIMVWIIKRGEHFVGYDHNERRVRDWAASMTGVSVERGLLEETAKAIRKQIYENQTNK